MANWGEALQTGLNVYAQRQAKRDEEKRTREDRMRSIRDKLTLANAQAGPQRRMTADGKVEEYQPQLSYDEETGYSKTDKPLRTMDNQWSPTSRSVKEAGGKVYTDTTERDLLGNERTQFNETEAAKKLRKERILNGDMQRDVMMDDQGNVVSELGSGPRYRPNAGGRSEDERIAYQDRQDKLARARMTDAERMRTDRSVADSVASQIREWREESKPERRALINKSLGLSETASEQEVRNAIRRRAMEDRGVTDQPRTEARTESRSSEPAKPSTFDAIAGALRKGASAATAPDATKPAQAPKPDKPKDDGPFPDDPQMNTEFNEDWGKAQQALQRVKGNKEAEAAIMKRMKDAYPMLQWK